MEKELYERLMGKLYCPYPIKDAKHGSFFGGRSILQILQRAKDHKNITILPRSKRSLEAPAWGSYNPILFKEPCHPFLAVLLHPLFFFGFTTWHGGAFDIVVQPDLTCVHFHGSLNGRDAFDRCKFTEACFEFEG